MWFKNSIRKEISKRRELNKKARKATDENKSVLKELYKQEKVKVQLLVRDAIKKHEEKIAEEIMNDKNRSQRIWLHINSMISKTQRSKKETHIFDKDGAKIGDSDIPFALKENWQPIYQKHQNEIYLIWNTEERNEYIEKHQAAK